MATWESLGSRGALDSYDWQHATDRLGHPARAAIAEVNDHAVAAARMLIDCGIFTESDLRIKVGQIRDRNIAMA